MNANSCVRKAKRTRHVWSSFTQCRKKIQIKEAIFKFYMDENKTAKIIYLSLFQ